jgi:hypothetical protein
VEDKLKKKPLSLLELLREAVEETVEEEKELDRYFRKIIAEHRFLKEDDFPMGETHMNYNFRDESIPFIADETKIEYLDSKHNELKEEKLNLNKEITEIEKNIKNLEGQIEDLDEKDLEDIPEEGGVFREISWTQEALEPNASGWSEANRQRMKDYNFVMKKPLPIGSGICYVLSVPENENWSKIGFTTKSAQERAEDYSKEHDLELNVAGIVADDNAAALEKILHEEFSSKRVKHGSAKEIFAVSPEECIEKIKSYKRKISEEVEYRQLVIIGIELLKLEAKIHKNKYKISSIDATIAIIISEQRKIFSEKLKKIFDLKIRPKSRKRWYRIFGWKARLKRCIQLLIYGLGVILILIIFSFSLYFFGWIIVPPTLIIIWFFWEDLRRLHPCILLHTDIHQSKS